MSERINLTEIEARCKAASPGPWLTPGELTPEETADEDRFQVVDHEGCRVRPWAEEADMKFAYAARTDLPALVAWVKDARDALIVARDDAERQERSAWVSRYDALLSRLEEKP